MLRLDKDKRLAISEAEVRQTCVEYAERLGYRYIPTEASNLTRRGRAAFPEGTLDGVFIHPRRGAIHTEWKRRKAYTDPARRKKQAEAEAGWVRQGYRVVRMPDGLSDPIGYFQQEFGRIA